MTKDEIIEMAKNAGFMVVHEGEPETGAWYECFTEEIERFAALVAEKEREACAQVCDEMETQYWRSTEDQSNFTPVDCSDAIRARKP